MAGSDDREKNEKEEANINNKRSEAPTVVVKQKPKEIQYKKDISIADKTMTGTLDIHCHIDDPKLQVKQASTEIHLVKHLMKMKTNPTIKHLTKFVNRLDKVVATINNLEGVKIMYKISDEMSEKVRNNMKELEFLSLEMKATLNNLCRLKEKKSLIRREKECITETRTFTKREEVQEMETVLGVYDKELLRNWNMTKKSTSMQAVENFILHLKGKKKAVEYAYKMATEKLLSMRMKSGRQSKSQKSAVIKALPPPSSDSDHDSINSTD